VVVDAAFFARAAAGASAGPVESLWGEGIGVEEGGRGECAAAVAAGGRAYFPQKRDLRELEAVERFKALEAAGGAAAVEKALKRKRVVLQKKDRTRLPPRA
jgi:hypothetical protein